VVVQEDLRAPQAWRALSDSEKKTFDLGYAVFNTEWSAARSPSDRTDGLGPLFNAPSCDACHNSRRRGRGPRAEGEAPADLVIQLGVVTADGHVQRGTREYGRVLNTAAIQGFTPEAVVSIHYEMKERVLADGDRVSLRAPQYTIEALSGSRLSRATVVMPRMPPSVQGVGLLERVPDSALIALAGSGQGKKGLGRFGWQATESTVADQTARAFASEMGLTTQRIERDDCSMLDQQCSSAPTGGSPEVEGALFQALVSFQEWHAVPNSEPRSNASKGARLFKQAGCATCHRPTLPVQGQTGVATIGAYTDLLLHDMGDALADRTIEGAVVKSGWRTAPLWGMSAAASSGQPLRLLHDGRARSIEEAILWHGGDASNAADRYTRFTASQRRALLGWIGKL
jgi:CxxC motif-containing protein (DUF1111 family)